MFGKLSRSSTGSSSLILVRVFHGEEESRVSEIYFKRGLSSLLCDILGEVQALFQEDGREVRRKSVHDEVVRALCSWNNPG